MFTLYQLTSQYKNALDWLSDEDNSKKELIDEIKESFENKIINCVKYLKNLEAESDAIKKEIEAMTSRHKSIGKQINRMSDYISMNLHESGLAEPVKCPEFSVQIRENPASVEIYDEHFIPMAYKTAKEVITINKDLIKKDLKEGFEIPGVCLIKKKRLVIK